MSFSKARIQRFNELGSEAPPPGSYDPKFDNKIKGLVIEKSERFQDNKSIASGSTECNLSVSSKSAAGIPPVAVFRTPQLPKKRVVAQPLTCSKIKWKAVNQVKDQKSKYETQQEVADLKVECMNKDKTIQEHEKHIEEMKETTGRLEKQLVELRKNQTDIEERHRRDIEAMAKLQREILSDHDEKHRLETEAMRTRLTKLSEEKEREIQARRATEDSLKYRISELIERTECLENQLAAKGPEENEIAEKLNVLLGESRERQNQLAAELDEMRRSKDRDITNLTNRMTEKDNRLASAEQEVRDLSRRNEELTSSLRKIKEDRDLKVQTIEKEKTELARYVNELESERSDIVAKLENRQKVILELQAQLSALQCELDELKAEYDKLIDDSSRQLSEFMHKHTEEVSRLKDIFAREKEALLNENERRKMQRLETEVTLKELGETNSLLKQELQDVQKLHKDVSEQLKEARLALEASNEMHAFATQEHKKEVQMLLDSREEERSKFQQLLDKARQEHLRELGHVMVESQKELAEAEQVSTRRVEEEAKRMKEHADRIVANAETVTRETLAACRAESEERVKRVIAESDAKVNSMIRDARNAVEEDMRLAAERYKACLTRVEMERAALDEKLSQRDAEINRLSATLEELKSSAETQESFSQSLQLELDKAETELAEKKEELRTLKDQIRAEAAEMVARRKRFEVVMTENQASVAALTQRLAESHAEVEKLQSKLNHGEKCIDEHRDLLSAMRNNSQLVHEQVRALTEQLDAKRDLVDQLEAGSLREFESIKAVFDAKIDHIKQVAAKELVKLQSECNKKTDQNLEMKKQLDEMAARLTDAQNMLLNLEEKNDVQAIQVSKVQLLNDKLEDQLNIHIRSIEKFRVQSAEHEKALQEANARAADLSAKLQSFNERDKHITEQLENEKRRRDMAEVEIKSLKENNDYLLKEYQLLSEKYTEVIGHQNHKQRIKHVTQLKDKIERLEQELQVKVRLLEQQQRLIDKLKAEDKRVHNKGKENALPIPKSAHTTPVSSPHKPLTPLRNRNE